MPTDISYRITKLRRDLLAFRFAYYCLHDSIISDVIYDKREEELKRLIKDNPEVEKTLSFAAICPTRTIGSDNPYDYPIEIEYLANRLLKALKENGVEKEVI